MTRTETIPALTLLLALAASAAAPAAAGDDSWRLKVSGVSAQSTAGGGSDSSLGGALALEYRATPRIGVELGGLRTEFEKEASVQLFTTDFVSELDFRMTPILARLNVHLTPGRRADLYVGPVAGYVLMSDVSHRYRPGPLVDDIPFVMPAEDRFAWGAHAGLDVQLGRGSSYLTAGATYLDLPLEVRVPDSIGPDGRFSGDFDPLVVHLGYGYRF